MRERVHGPRGMSLLAGIRRKRKEDPGVVRGLFVSVSVYMASAAPLNQVERSRGLLCKLQPWLKSSALKYWMINQRVQYLGVWKTCLSRSFAKSYQFLNVFEKWTQTDSFESLLILSIFLRFDSTFLEKPLEGYFVRIFTDNRQTRRR